MSQFMQILKKRITYFCWAFAAAFSYFLISYVIIFKLLVNGDIAASTLLNSLTIIFFLVLGELENHRVKKYKEKPKKEDKSIFSRIARAYYYEAPDMSMKSALYLFYIGLLVCVAIVEVKPDFPVLRDMTEYFQSVQYGILLLIATDIFLQQMLKDENAKDNKT